MVSIHHSGEFTMTSLPLANFQPQAVAEAKSLQGYLGQTSVRPAVQFL